MLNETARYDNDLGSLSQLEENNHDFIYYLNVFHKHIILSSFSSKEVSLLSALENVKNYTPIFLYHKPSIQS